MLDCVMCMQQAINLTAEPPRGTHAAPTPLLQAPAGTKRATACLDLSFRSLSRGVLGEIMTSPGDMYPPRSPDVPARGRMGRASNALGAAPEAQAMTWPWREAWNWPS